MTVQHQVSMVMAASSSFTFKLSHCLLALLAWHLTLSALTKSGTITRRQNSEMTFGKVTTAKISW
ncbi:MAG TPA: hypothetical protein VJ180_10395 [Pyrinomonadaceae bacterium]|nr:hypothetical protein [Pyrinomonadaceae bacterium]